MVNAVSLRERLLIVCEGARTEPSYFRRFRLNGDVVGLGDHTLSLVQRAIALRDDDGAFTETWVVMDRDDFELGRFQQAVALANRERIRLALSHQAFELWYLLHFEYCDADLHRSTCTERLARYLGRPYLKNDPDMHAALLSRQGEALRNAERLRQSHGASWDPAHHGPGTTVDLLVKRLNDLAR